VTKIPKLRCEKYLPKLKPIEWKASMENYALATAEWLENRVRAQEKKFPQLIALKFAVKVTTREVKAAKTDDDIQRALDRQNKAIYALITSLPT
jgi:sporulation-control protein spo0M